MNDSYVVLFDFDSMIYKAVYKICSFSDIRFWFRDGKTKEWMITEIVNLSLNRLFNMSDNILIDIEDTGVEIDFVEYFLTACTESERKRRYPSYKANRKTNKWVKLVRDELIKMDSFIHDSKWEADDLIKDRAVELGDDKYVICTVDKDLKQIHGIHFDYYRPRLLNPDGSIQTNINGERKIAPCRGLSIVTKEEASIFFWTQMLMGDSGDNIKGLPRIGKKRAKSILSTSIDHENTVRYKYVSQFGSTEGEYQFKLHKLLIGLGVKHRP